MRWRLAHENHAIERVAVVFQFAEAIPSKAWSALISAADAEMLKSGFLVSPIHANHIQFTIPPLAQQGGNVGLMVMGQEHAGEAFPQNRHFQMARGGEIQEDVTLNRTHFVYQIPVYSRWNPFRDRLMGLLSAHLEAVLPLIALQAIKLEYWDRFVFDGPREQADYSELLRAGSRLVPGLPTDMTELWHSHVGFFAPKGDYVKRLMHLNIDVMDVPDMNQQTSGQAPEMKRSVGIYSMAQDQFDHTTSPANTTSILPKLNDMHKKLKDVLADVLTEDAATKINLNSQSAV